MRDRLPAFVVAVVMTVLIFAVLMLGGCATQPERPSTEVQVPVRVSCVKGAPVRPVYETEGLPPTAKPGQKVVALARDWARSRDYEAALEVVVEGCR